MRPSEHLNAAEFVASADDVFGRIASRYDLLCDLFSIGIHRLWKRRVATLVAAQPWHDLLDSASGTGDIVIRALNQQPGGLARRIVASDISPQMLAIAERRLSALTHSVELRQLDAHCMPSVPAESVDLYSISLGLKICNRQAVLHEALRVLKPGGRLIVLEASNIPVRWLHQMYLLYMAVCMPLIGWLATGGDASAYRYLLHGIREFPTAEALAEEIRQVGFVDVKFERLSGGIVAIHVGHKPHVSVA
jgi:demethylmenaquinone methyltransferase/2-methoxy-6-polyprenyl-1,4-benzoquinol methylase